MTAPDPDPDARRDAIVLALATAALLAPFLGKPPHVDDPLFLLAAERIRHAPLDFYGVRVNWYGHEEPLYGVAQNPPGASYLLALFGLAGGVVAMHAGFVLAAVAAVLGVRALAREAGAPPLAAGFAALSMPVFLVSATTLMCDVPMTALSVWAVVLWLRGLTRDRAPLLYAGAALTALAALTKYYGVCLVPLLVLAALLHRRRVLRWGPPLLVVLAALAGYEAFTRVRYGQGLLTAAFSYAASIGKTTPLVDRGAQGIVYAGGCVVSLVAFAPLFLTKRSAAACVLAAAAVTGFLLWRGRIGTWPLTDADGFRGAAFAHAIVYVAAAALAGWLLLRAAGVARPPGAPRDPDAVVLAAWVAGTFVFAAFVNWTTNGRSVLPVVPPLAVLLARELRGGTRARAAATVPGIVLALLVAWGDARLAGSNPVVAETIRTQAGVPPDRIWFQGHWGFQTAMEAIGARPLDLGVSRVKADDLIVVPHNNSNCGGMPPAYVRELATFEIEIGAPASTMARSSGSGFYSTIWGPLPFALGTGPPERFTIFAVTKPFPVR